LRILIADDDDLFLKIISEILTEAGHEVILASNGHDALETATRECPDLIVLDIILPDLLGTEVREKLRKNDRTAPIPILMVTSGVAEIEQERSSLDNLSTDDFLRKPFGPEDLITKVNKLLKSPSKFSPQTKNKLPAPPVSRIQLDRSAETKGKVQDADIGKDGGTVERNLKTLGRYKLLALLATGGMAEIHLARQSGIEGFERIVVVKKILPHLASDKSFLEMFFDEARIAAMLNHPNIVQIYDLGKEGNEYFIAMEYLEGESLAYLEREARRKKMLMPPHLAAGIIAMLCDGLDYAHAFQGPEGEHLQIVHRDVSPQNAIILFSGGVKLVDFGIAKAASQLHKTRVGTMKGKLTYMSPEQVLGKTVDHRSDIFSLGVILWEILTRRRLFKRPSEPATIQAIMNEDIPKIRDIRPEVPEALEAVALKALEKDPDNRFGNAAEMGNALRDHIREASLSAGTSEISSFIGEVFAERMRSKKYLLGRINSSDSELSDVALLKPETSQSMPSLSRIEDLPTPTDPSKQVPPKSATPPPWAEAPSASEQEQPPETPSPSPEPNLSPKIEEQEAGEQEQLSETESPSTESTSSEKPGKRFPTLILATLAGVLLGCGLIAWWALTKNSAPETQVTTKEPPSEVVAVDAGVVQKKLAPKEVKIVRLSIISRPKGCKIMLDGNALAGLTPMENVAIMPGKKYKVAAICKNHEEEIKIFTYQPDKPSQLYFEPTPLKGVKTPVYGFLRLDTDPWSEIRLGKRKLGITPLLKIRLKVGKHKLTAINRELGIKKTIIVTIRPRRTTKLFRKIGK
jgi:eukaryotic-like serine/threonine-protein kinase